MCTQIQLAAIDSNKKCNVGKTQGAVGNHILLEHYLALFTFTSVFAVFFMIFAFGGTPRWHHCQTITQ